MKKQMILVILLVFLVGILTTACSEESANIAGEAYKSLKYKKAKSVSDPRQIRLDRFRTNEQKLTSAPLCDVNNRFQPTNELVPKKFCNCLAQHKPDTYCEFTYLRGVPGKQ